MKSLSVEPPHAIVTVGIAGSGKTTFAEKFAATFNAPYIQQEHIETYCANEAGSQEIVNTMIEQVVKTKQSIVIDVDTSSRTSRLSLAKYLRQVGYVPLFIWVQMDERTGAARTLKRKNISQADYQRLLKHFTMPHITEQALVLSGKHTYPSQAKIVLKKLSANRVNRQQSVTQAPRRQGKILIR